VRVVEVRIEGAKTVAKYFNSLVSRLPNASREGMRKAGEGFERELRRQVLGRGLIWNARLFQSIHWRQRGNIGTMSVVNYGVALDAMPPHYVSLKRGRKITQWAKEKGFDTKRTKAIYVKAPHAKGWLTDSTVWFVNYLPEKINEEIGTEINSKR